MTKLFHILLYKFISYLKLERNLSVFKIFQNFGSVIVYSAFGIGAYLFSYEIIQFLLIKTKIGDFLLHEFIGIILFIFFISVNVGNIIVSYSTLFKSAEVNYFFTKPIAPIQIFVIKFLDNFFYSSGTLIMVLLALFAGYYSYYQPNIWELSFIIVFNFFPFLLTAASLGAIILFVVLRLSVKFGLRKIITILISLYVFGVILFFNTNTPIDLVNNVMKHYPNVDLYFGYLLSDFVKLLPNNWIAESLYWMLNDKFSISLQYCILQLNTSVVIFIIALLIGKKWYAKIWKTIPTFRKPKKIKKTNLLFEKRSILNTVTESIYKKDLLLFFREPSQVIHSSILLFLILIFISSIKSVSLIGESNIQLQSILFLVVYLFNAFFISTLSLRFVFPLISLEGMAFWKIKTAPVKQWKYLLSRLTPQLLIIIFLSQIISYFSSKAFTAELQIFSALLTFFISITLVLMNFGMGTIFANYKEKNPIRIASSQGASLSFLLSLVYMVAIISLIFLPINDYFYRFHNRINTNSFTYSFNTALGIIAVISFLISLFYLLTLKSSLKRDF